MRTLIAVMLALLVASIGIHLLLPAMSNGGALAGFDFFGLLGIGAFCMVSYYLVARVQAASHVLLWLQAGLVGVSAPFVVLLAPLVFCIAFRPGASCV